MPAVTVIIPMYNVAMYIERCARSIFEQSLLDLEIIFIDDCSPDNSSEIVHAVLQDYPERIKSTKIIKQEKNTGLAGARKRGIEEATGKYIIHCDGDDWIDRDLYKKMYDKAEEERADIIICDFIYECTTNSNHAKQTIISDQASEILENWYSHFLHMSVANKLVRRDLLIKNQIFPWIGLNMWEDNSVMLRVFAMADKVSHIETSCYHYNRTNTTSISSQYGRPQVNQMIEVAKRVGEFYEGLPDGKKYKNTQLALQFYAKVNLITDNFSDLKLYRQLFPKADSIAKDLDPRSFSLKGRIRWMMVKYHLAPLFIILFKVLNRIKN